MQEVGLNALAAGCRNLDMLMLTGCSQASEDGLCAICDSNTSLKFLSLALNAEISDDAVARCLRHLKRVHELDLSGCTQLGRQIGPAIARNCEWVEDLKLSRTEVGDVQVHRMLVDCTRLRRLDLSGCHLLTDDGVIAAVPQARELQTLVLTHTPGITDECVDQIKRKCSSLTVVREAQRFVNPTDLTKVLGPQIIPKAKPKPKKKANKAVSKARTSSKVRDNSKSRSSKNKRSSSSG